jgi:hypothetical protein
MQLRCHGRSQSLISCFVGRDPAPDRQTSVCCAEQNEGSTGHHRARKPSRRTSNRKCVLHLISNVTQYSLAESDASVFRARRVCHKWNKWHEYTHEGGVGAPSRVSVPPLLPVTYSRSAKLRVVCAFETSVNMYRIT